MGREGKTAQHMMPCTCMCFMAWEGAHGPPPPLQMRPLMDTRMHAGPRSQGKRKREVSRWTPPEETELQRAVAALGTMDWVRIADAVGTRSARQCKEHYREVLRYAS